MHGTLKKEIESRFKRRGQSAPAPNHEEGSADKDSEAVVREVTGLEASPNGLQPPDNRPERVEFLLRFLDQHGFTTAYELRSNPAGVLWVVRPAHKFVPQIELALQEPCQATFYF